MNATAMTINSSGTVGIGNNFTVDPSVKLDVHGDVHVNGKIKMGSAGWTIQTPDYVFGPSYALPKIDETAKYIKENRHLPDVPSAAEVKKNGIDVAQMNMALLKNLETVTLYVIEQKKEIDDQNKKIEQLQAQVQQLAKK